ncbi:MAG: glycosyltransferase family 4 protein [Armatimonadota bacterium]
MGRGNNSIKLALNYISYMLSASLKVFFLRDAFDIVFVYQLSPVIMAIPAIIYKKISKKKLLLYCLDLWPESLKTMNIVASSFVFKYVSKVSKWIYNQCDFIIVSTESFINYLVNINEVTRSHVAFLPQHAEELYLSVTENNEPKEQIDFLFAGNIGKMQNIECILHAVSRIETERKYRVNFVGDGSFLEEARLLAIKLNIKDKIVFHGQHPLKEMVVYYSTADAFLITLKGGSSVGGTVPSKLQGYMAAGKPILGAISGAANELIKESNCGYCVESDDIDGLRHLMEDFINAPDQYRHLGDNGRKYFMENFTLDKFKLKLVQTLTQLIEES